MQNGIGEIEKDVSDIAPPRAKLFGNEEIRTQILPILFPTGEVFKLLKEYFNTQTLPVYKTLADAIGAV